ncbi:MAG: hypothetical protein H7247_11360 [Polaromonas sp.]|nr:hypothetical protein [Gemmatimonadaceae bacterium]
MTAQDRDEQFLSVASDVMCCVDYTGWFRLRDDESSWSSISRHASMRCGHSICTPRYDTYVVSQFGVPDAHVNGG